MSRNSAMCPPQSFTRRSGRARRTAAAVIFALVVSLGISFQPANAGGWKNCVGSVYSGVQTWGYSSYWSSHGHVVNGWITFREGVYSSVSHPAPPSSSGFNNTYNTWDVTNVSAEGASCWIMT